jgi:hypothetical protein
MIIPLIDNPIRLICLLIFRSHPVDDRIRYSCLVFRRPCLQLGHLHRGLPHRDQSLQIRRRIFDIIRLRRSFPCLLHLGDERVPPGRREHRQPSLMKNDDVILKSLIVERLNIVRVNEQRGVVVEPAFGEPQLFCHHLGCCSPGTPFPFPKKSTSAVDARVPVDQSCSV